MNTESIITSKNGIQQIGVSKGVASPQLPKTKDATMNLRDRANDVLLTEKHNLISYQTAINEIIDDDLRNIVINNRNNTQGVQVKFFNELFNMGEYKADVASTAQIADTVDTFTNYKTQLPYK